MSITHTPGPWAATESKDFSGNPIFYIAQCSEAPYTSNFSDVATVRIETVSAEQKQIQAANAALISAAPQLLECLKWAIEFPDDNAYWLTQANAAIEKATKLSDTPVGDSGGKP